MAHLAGLTRSMVSRIISLPGEDGNPQQYRVQVATSVLVVGANGHAPTASERAAVSSAALHGVLQEFLHLPITQQDVEAAKERSATAIASIFRGLLARRRTVLRRLAHAAAAAIRLRAAAVVIARVYRGHVGRRLTIHLRLAHAAATAVRCRAATAIARVYRGHVSRRLFIHRRLAHAAAAHIQGCAATAIARVYRGRVGRRLFIHRRLAHAAALFVRQLRAAVAITRVYRGFVSRRLTVIRFLAQAAAAAGRRRRAAVVATRTVCRFLAQVAAAAGRRRLAARRRRLAAIAISRVYRGHVGRSLLRRKREAEEQRRRRRQEDRARREQEAADHRTEEERRQEAERSAAAAAAAEEAAAAVATEEARQAEEAAAAAAAEEARQAAAAAAEEARQAAAAEEARQAAAAEHARQAAAAAAEEARQAAAAELARQAAAAEEARCLEEQAAEPPAGPRRSKRLQEKELSEHDPTSFPADEDSSVGGDESPGGGVCVDDPSDDNDEEPEKAVDPRPGKPWLPTFKTGTFGDIFNTQLLLKPEEEAKLLNDLPKKITRNWLKNKLKAIMALKDQLDDATAEVDSFERLINHVVMKQINKVALHGKEKQLIDTLFTKNDPTSDELKDYMYHVTCTFIKTCFETGRIFEAPPGSCKGGFRQACHQNQRVTLSYLMGNSTDMVRYLKRNHKKDKREKDIGFTVAVGVQAICFKKLVRNDTVIMVRLAGLLSTKPALILAGYDAAQVRRELKKSLPNGADAVPLRQLDQLISYKELEEKTSLMIDSHRRRYNKNHKITTVTNEDAMAPYIPNNDYGSGEDVPGDKKGSGEDAGGEDGDDAGPEEERKEMELKRVRAGYRPRLPGAKGLRRPQLPTTQSGGHRKRKRKDAALVCAIKTPKQKRRVSLSSPESTTTGETIVGLLWRDTRVRDIALKRKCIKEQIRNRHIIRFQYKDKTFEALFHYSNASGERCCPVELQTFRKAELMSEMCLEEDSDRHEMALFSAPELATTVVMKLDVGVDPFHYQRYRHPSPVGVGKTSFLLLAAKKESRMAVLLQDHYDGGRVFALFVDEGVDNDSVDSDSNESEMVQFAGYGFLQPYRPGIEYFEWVKHNDDNNKCLLNRMEQEEQRLTTFYTFHFLEQVQSVTLPYQVRGNSCPPGWWHYKALLERDLNKDVELRFAVPNDSLTRNGGQVRTENMLDEVNLDVDAFEHAFYTMFLEESVDEYPSVDGDIMELRAEQNEFGLSLEDLFLYDN